MPRLKQPAPLETSAMDTLVDFFLQFFRQCSQNDSLDELREIVRFVKNNIRPRMPGKMAAELYNRVLGEFSSPSRVVLFFPHRHIGIVTEVLMDDEITGLECSSDILASLQSDDAGRIRGMSKLELYDTIPHNLGVLRLEHLTVFKYRYHCTDSDLAILSQHCPQLNHVEISESNRITNVGLCALASCSDLVSLKASCCSKISLIGLKHFLSVNKSIRELFAWSDSDDAGFDFSKDPEWDEDPSVYLSITSFTIGRRFSNSHNLVSVVAKFPNLKSVKLYETFEGDMSALKSLSNLSRIDFVAGYGYSLGRFKSLLGIVGPQIVKMVIYCKNISTSQRGLNSIFQRCENLESLTLECECIFDERELVVPPFNKLKHFRCTLCDETESATLELDQMLMLENLWMFGFNIAGSRIKSMIIDPMSFPNLKEIASSEFYDCTDFDSIEQLAKSNNLDLKLEQL